MTCKKRLFRVLAWAGAVLLTALAYVCVIRVLGRGLYCPIWTLTGRYCPGCGVSRMCLRLLRLDLAGAFRANPLLLLASPVIAGLLLTHLVRYVRVGKGAAPRWEEGVWIALAVVFLLYGVVRNLPMFSFLAPC